MNNEEKILQMLTKLTGDVAGLKGDVAGLKGDVAELKATQAQQGERLDEMQDTLTRVSVTQEGVVLPRLQALYEGHEAIMEQLKKKADNDRMYELAGDVPMMKDSIKRLRTDVNELKKSAIKTRPRCASTGDGSRRSDKIATPITSPILSHFIGGMQP